MSASTAATMFAQPGVSCMQMVDLRTGSWFFSQSAKAAATWRSKLATLCPDRGLPGMGPGRTTAHSRWNGSSRYVSTWRGLQDPESVGTLAESVGCGNRRLRHPHFSTTPATGPAVVYRPSSQIGGSNSLSPWALASHKLYGGNLQYLTINE